MCLTNTKWTTTNGSGKLMGCFIVAIRVSVCVPLWNRVRTWGLPWVYEHGYKWENVAYVCSSSQLFHHCNYLRGSGADPAHKHSSPSQWALLGLCHSYFARHLDTLTATHCTLGATSNTQLYTVNYPGRHFTPQNANHQKCVTNVKRRSTL